jgi:predicted amidohydrolase YtcJ
VNTRAMEVAGITPGPAHGRFERDPDGHPTGTLHEGAMHVVSRLVPATSAEAYYQGLLAGQSYLHSLGVTGWQDAIVGSYAGMDDPGPTYLDAAQRGDLTAHVVGALWWDRDRGEEQIDSLIERRASYSRGRFRATSVKVMQDGVAENGTAALSAPYLDRCGHATTNSGHSFVDPVALRRYVARLDAEGFQVHVHGIGDRGVREALDAFEGIASGSATGNPNRHHIAHLQLVHPDDVRRFGQLGVAANLQALWACLDDQMTDLTLPFIGEERATWQYPFGSLHRSGARLVAGSDWPVSTPNPLEAIHVAVSRWAFGEEGPAGHEPFLPDQALDLETAFAAYTSGSAWVNHRDDAGTLAPGQVADLVVLDRDPFAGDPAEIGAAQVVSTWVDGTVVFEV